MYEANLRVYRSLSMFYNSICTGIDWIEKGKEKKTVTDRNEGKKRRERSTMNDGQR